MSASFASRIERVEPERVLLTSHAGARVRVVGSARGWLRCGAERRWVWGRFDETFLVQRCAGALVIRAAGLGGWQTRRLPVNARVDVRPARVRTRKPRLRFQTPRAPRLRALTHAGVRALTHAGLRALTHADLTSREEARHG